jgi:hypothetical protein
LVVMLLLLLFLLSFGVSLVLPPFTIVLGRIVVNKCL